MLQRQYVDRKGAIRGHGREDDSAAVEPPKEQVDKVNDTPFSI